jgi:uncharacterized membrane protein
MIERLSGAKTKRAAWLDWGPMAGFVVFSAVAVAGWAVFGRDPSRVVGLSEWGARFYAVSFGFFAQAQVLLAGLVLVIHLARKGGWGWLPAFVGIYVLSLASELSGTAFGIPFGPYAYTDLLGPKWLGLVPALIPLSWFFMAVPSYALARRVAGEGRPGRRRQGSRGPGSAGLESKGSAVERVLLGSLLLVIWDLSLDPAMSEATRYWVWGEPGPYYGMPLVNLVGWFVTGLVLMGVLEALRSARWVERIRGRWWGAYYGANLVLPLGMSMAAGYWGAAVATALGMGGVVVWASLRSRTRSGESPARVARTSSGAEVVG